MTTKRQAAKEAIRRSRIALRKGDKDSARLWAEKAASLAPKFEEPWLLLAAVSRPQLSIRYLERAQAINPKSERVRRGFIWANKRLSQRVGKTQPTLAVNGRASSRKTPQPDKVPSSVGGLLHIPVQQIEETQPIKAIPTNRNSGKWRQSLPALLMTIIIVSAVWALSPRVTSFAATLNATATATLSQEHWAQAEISKPTYTPSPTATFTPTLTPTLTATPTFTPIPTETPIPTKKPLPANTAIPAPQQGPAPSGGKYVLVDISEQRVYAYQGDTLVYKFIASTGLNNATATGSFSILNKIPNAYGSTWDIWMPNWLGIYWAGTLQNGFHALPIMSSGARLWAGYLGSPISYGCIVLGVYDAQQLYNWVNVGTPVDIQW
ncbi:MAG: L,D-transpeptidase family protein [Anaerolineales bacterium]|uniref:L,D-transpeptidase family protein n=1 Tax=Candidatus Desulfolinea nitratireducens TaxID=2841698 RepID=A0A8J6NNH9_9CHLR|nr:L,D-transpeptidase family protein [Candidatus Desulfolinea nitratireducens]MBL6961989.1 L,D-transpeptidase family protein [Anaerolineales bacterium]